MHKVFFGMLVGAGLLFGIWLITRPHPPSREQIDAQDSGASSPVTTRASRVPFVGCPSDGQAGPVPAPRGKSKSVRIDAKAAQQLAYYESTQHFGVLAPRGWHCFGTYGSDGNSLFVSLEAIS